MKKHMQQICNRFVDSNHYGVVPINYLLAKKLGVKIKDFGYTNVDIMVIQPNQFVKYSSDRIIKSSLYNEDDIVYFYYKSMLGLSK